MTPSLTRMGELILSRLAVQPCCLSDVPKGEASPQKDNV
jgi:hypothetical protein